MTDTIISLPSVDWQSVDFDPIKPRFGERMEGRRVEELVMPTGWWVARYETEQLDARAMGRMEAFMMDAGAGALIRAYDPLRPRPIAHDLGRPLSGTRSGGGTFDGTAPVQTIIDATTLVVAGLPAGFQLLAGDYMEVRMGPLLVSLHMVRSDAKADAAGVATLLFRHELDLQHFTSAATVNFEEPCCLMKIDAGSQKPVKNRMERRASFTAQEFFPSPEAV